MSIPLPACGIHYGVPFEQYQSWPAVNFSTLKEIRDTASKCKWAMEHPKKQTPAMIIGSALHIATLEPARFEGMFHICPPCNKTTTEGKAIWAQAVADANGKLIIRQGSKDDESVLGEVENIRGMVKAIHGSVIAARFIDGKGQNEVSMLWKDGETGLMCKARVDRFIQEFEPWGCPVIAEIKSTRDAREWEFSKDIVSKAYHIQAASYCHAYQEITGVRPAHVFISVENFAPFDIQTHMLDDADLQTGLVKYRELLTRYAACVKSGTWPGYPDKLNKLTLPKWAN